MVQTKLSVALILAVAAAAIAPVVARPTPPPDGAPASETHPPAVAHPPVTQDGRNFGHVEVIRAEGKTHVNMQTHPNLHTVVKILRATAQDTGKPLSHQQGDTHVVNLPVPDGHRVDIRLQNRFDKGLKIEYDPHHGGTDDARTNIIHEDHGLPHPELSTTTAKVHSLHTGVETTVHVNHPPWYDPPDFNAHSSHPVAHRSIGPRHGGSNSFTVQRTEGKTSVFMLTHPDHPHTQVNILPATAHFRAVADEGTHMIDLPVPNGRRVDIHLLHKQNNRFTIKHDPHHDTDDARTTVIHEQERPEHSVLIASTAKIHSLHTGVETTVHVNHPPGYQPPVFPPLPSRPGLGP